jgi:periplasmic divalent cation tolerance protein
VSSKGTGFAQEELVSRTVKRSSSGVLLVLVTTSSRKEAIQIAEAAVRKKLAACGNVLPSVTSIFRWDGKIERSREALLILKTSEGRFAALQEFVRSMHSYEVPEVIAVTVSQGLPPYMEWVLNETATD